MHSNTRQCLRPLSGPYSVDNDCVVVWAMPANHLNNGYIHGTSRRRALLPVPPSSRHLCGNMCKLIPLGHHTHAVDTAMASRDPAHKRSAAERKRIRSAQAGTRVQLRPAATAQQTNICRRNLKRVSSSPPPGEQNKLPPAASSQM